MADTGNVNVDTLVKEATFYLDAWSSDQLPDEIATVRRIVFDLAARAREPQSYREKRLVLRWQEADADRDRLARRVAELEAALREVTEFAAEFAHAYDGEWDGYDGSGIHAYEPNDPQDCRLCAAIDKARALAGDGGGA